MTDRVQNLTVILDGDYRTDDVEEIVKAIQMIRGVGAVELGEPVTMNDHYARKRVYLDVYTKLVQSIREILIDT